MHGSIAGRRAHERYERDDLHRAGNLSAPWDKTVED
jgi:hypothetical protein